MTDFFSIAPLSWPALATALICGFIIGLERQLSGKPIGIRTSTLICMGAYVFVAASSLLPTSQDHARILAQIVTGIGFIGGGVILARGRNIIGVTSASVIWILAGAGILIGLGRFGAALILSVLVVAVLTGVNLIEKGVKALDHRFIHADDHEE